MEKVAPQRDRPLSARRALERIQRMWGEGKVTWQPEVEKKARMLGLSDADLANVIRRGAVTAHERCGRKWAYIVSGEDLDERPLGYAVELAGISMVIRVITRDRITEE